MMVYEKHFFSTLAVKLNKISSFETQKIQNFLSGAGLKIFFHGQLLHYKTIYESVRIEWYSCRVQ